MTVNAEIRDATLRHQINLEQFAVRATDRVLRNLSESDRRIVALLLQNQLEDVSEGRRRLRLESVIRRIRDINAESRVEVSAALRDETTALGEEERDFNELLLVPFFLLLYNRRPVIPGAGSVRSAVLTTPYRGTRRNFAAQRQHVQEFFRIRHQRIADELRLGFAAGEETTATVRRLRERRTGTFAQQRRELGAISRSSFTAAAAAASSKVAEENEEVISERWDTTLDGRACLVCASRHGLQFPVGEGPYPPAHPNCRCVRRKVLRDGGAVDIDSFDEWLRRQPRAVQEQVLGKTRFRLFRAGKLSVRRFVDRPDVDTGSVSGNHIFTIAELRASDDAALRDAFRKAGLSDG